jgi:hypothetical protein
MEAKSDSRSTSIPTEISLVRGGPFYRIQQALGLIRPNRWNLGRRIAVLIAIGWLPLLLITAFSNPKALPSFLVEYRIHARMLIAVPALLLGELFMESRFRAVLAHLRRSGLLEAPDLAYMDGVVATLARLRDAYLPELAVLILLIVHTVLSYKGLIDATPWVGQGTAPNIRLTAAGWYAVVVSAPLFQFLLGLGLWRWLLWTFFAFKLSRRNLKVVATHPDEHGGLGFLGLTASAFAPVTFAATAVIGATWRYDILHHGAHLMDFKLPAIALVAIIAVVALGPLIFFVPALGALRRRGILEYGILGQTQSAEFHDKWIRQREGHETEFLQAPDSSALNDFGQSYERIKQLKPFPADTGSLYVLAAAIVVPALPVVLAQIPVAVVLSALFKALR